MRVSTGWQKPELHAALVGGKVTGIRSGSGDRRSPVTACKIPTRRKQPGVDQVPSGEIRGRSSRKRGRTRRQDPQGRTDKGSSSRVAETERRKWQRKDPGPRSEGAPLPFCFFKEEEMFIYCCIITDTWGVFSEIKGESLQEVRLCRIRGEQSRTAAESPPELSSFLFVPDVCAHAWV